MANNDYDDLLESFMNNSQKVYNDDKDSQKAGSNLPSDYNTYTKGDNKQARANKKNDSASSRNSKKQPPKKQRSKTGTTIGRIIVGALMVIAVVAVVCFSVIAIYGFSVVHGDAVFDLKEEASSQNQTSFIYRYDDNNEPKLVTTLHGEENRVWVNLDDMSPYMSKAVIAIEDERFEKHHGVDWKRVISVTVKMNGQGGSTLTQQLIKNLTDENSVTFVRKFNEILSALNLEKHYSKDEIMEGYLNTIYLSHGCYGVKTAAETYFGKNPEDLNIAECACLAGITQFPTKYDPLINPENNQDRQRRIIEKMHDQGFITDAEYNEAINYKMIYTNSPDYKGSQVTKDESTNANKDKVNSYYTDFVIDQVIQDLQKMGYSTKKARNMIYGGGLKIYSAMDMDVQKSIEEVYKNYQKMPDKTVQSACVVMDYKGRILGMVGGTGKKKANRVLNRAWQSKRQPGSTIKPLSVYGPALEKSLNDDDVDIYWSTPTKDAPLLTINGKKWPTNEGGGYSGKNVTVQRGLANSMNTISAQTLDKIGTTYSYDYITNKFHISTLELSDCDYAPMATGSVTNGVTVLEMTTAYQAFGNGGYYYEGYSYYKIEDSQGNVLIEKAPEKTKESALTESTAWLMNKMLQTVMTQGTGRSYKLSSVECFGKTGTTTENKDRWFIGGTPEYVGGVWYGYDQPKEVHYYLSPNPCGTIWNLVMKNIYDKKGINENKFPDYDGIVHREYSPANGLLCRGTGQWGWYDKENLPSVTTYVATTGESTSTTEGDGNSSDSENTTVATDETTAAEPASQPEQQDQQVQ